MPRLTRADRARNLIQRLTRLEHELAALTASDANLGPYDEGRHDGYADALTEARRILGAGEGRRADRAQALIDRYDTMVLAVTAQVAEPPEALTKPQGRLAAYRHALGLASGWLLDEHGRP